MFCALNIVAAYNATSHAFTFTNTTTDNPFVFYSTGSTAPLFFGFNNADRQSDLTRTNCTLVNIRENH